MGLTHLCYQLLTFLFIQDPSEDPEASIEDILFMNSNSTLKCSGTTDVQTTTVAAAMTESYADTEETLGAFIENSTESFSEDSLSTTADPTLYSRPLLQDFHPMDCTDIVIGSVKGM